MVKIFDKSTLAKLHEKFSENFISKLSLKFENKTKQKKQNKKTPNK